MGKIYVNPVVDQFSQLACMKIYVKFCIDLSKCDETLYSNAGRRCIQNRILNCHFFEHIDSKWPNSWVVLGCYFNKISAHNNKNP